MKTLKYLITFLIVMLFFWACSGPKCLNGVLIFGEKKVSLCDPVLS